MAIITNVAELKPGTWYACGFEDESGRIDWGGSMIYRYNGDGQWSDEDGEPVESLWCYDLQMHVAMDAADAYAPQP